MFKQKLSGLSTTFTTIMLACLLSGCSAPVAQNDGLSEANTETASNTDSGAPETDIATQPNTLPEKDATAKQVCQRFLGLLAQGERSFAEQLLTRRALKVAVEGGLELEPVGDSDSSVEVEDAVYATSRAKVAHVACKVTAKDGSQNTMSWLMRRGDSGWRVAGLIVGSGKSMEFLSLENPADVASIVGSKGGNSAADEVRLVSGTDDE